MEYKELIELIKTVSDSNIVDFQYEQDGTKIVMCSGETQAVQQVVSVPAASEAVEEKTIATVQNEPRKVSGNVVKSPLVGTFYVAPAEGAEPFVKVGDSVKKGQTLAIVEAMKLMNEIESDYDGVVSDVLVENGKMVEYGQPLFCIS